MVRGYKTKEGLTRGTLHENQVILLENLKKNIKRQGRVCIERFGCFEVVKVKARKFRNNTGKMSMTPSFLKVSFRASLPFKKYINER